MANTPVARQRLLNRDFLLLWQGQTVSGVGTSLFQISLIYWLMETTNSATIMGLVSAAAALPGVILGPFGGAIADRYSRRKLIIWGDVILGVAMLSLSVPFFLLDGSVETKIAWLVAVSILTGVVGTFFRPAVMAAIPNLVPARRLQAANAMNGLSMTSSMAVGQAIGGVLYRVLGAPVLIMINGVSYLLSAFSEIFIRMPQELPLAPQSGRELLRVFLDEMIEGLRYVWHNKGLKNLMVAFALLNLVSAPMGVLMPLLLDRHRGLPPDWYGYLMAAMAVGNIIGMSMAGAMSIDGRARLYWALAALYCMGGTTVVMGVAESPYSLLAANLTTGFFMGIMMVTFTTLMQATTPDLLRGRVSSVMMTVMMGTMPVALGLAGVLADLVNQDIPLLFVASGIITIGMVTLMGTNRAFREYLGTHLGGRWHTEMDTAAAAEADGAPRA